MVSGLADQLVVVSDRTAGAFKKIGTTPSVVLGILKAFDRV